MPATSSVNPTGDPYVDGVIYGVKWAVDSFTFSFPTSGSYYGSGGFFSSGYGDGENRNGFQALNSAQKETVRDALADYAAVANVTFTEITETSSTHADLRYAESNAPTTAYAYLPTTSAEGGDAWFNHSDYNAPVKGDYAYVSFIHETGHALGLKHPHEAGTGAFAPMPADHDSIEYSVMSYRSYVGQPIEGYTNETYGFPQSPMMYDIAAVQALYGANYDTNSGDTVYSWSPTTGEMFIDGEGQGAPGANRIFLTVWDGGGNDTYDFSNYTTGLVVSLEPGGWTTTSPTQLALLNAYYVNSEGADPIYAVGNIANALLYEDNPASLIENAIGGSGSDSITGNAADNILDGRTGNDTLTGEGGADTFVFSPGDDADVVTDFSTSDKVDLRGFADIGSLGQVLALATQEGSDVVIDFGNGDTLTLQDFDKGDLAPGNFIMNVLPTGARPTAMDLSANSAVEGAAAGTVIGTLSTIDPDVGDTFSYALTDSAGGLFAIDGDKLIVAGTLNYETGASYDVTVRVTDSGNQVYDKTFTIDVTDVPPTNLVDGNGSANRVAEGASAGTAVGITATATDPAGGPLTYTLTDDADGRFAIDPTTGIVTVADGSRIDYETATSHQITVQASDGEYTTSSSFAIAVTDVAGATQNGGRRADTLTGTSENDTLNGNNGNDTLIGLGGADKLNGGSGTDTASYAASAAGIIVSLAAGTAHGGDAEGDTFNAIENITGSGQNDTIEGSSGNNVLDGGAGIDTLSYASATGNVKISLASTGAQATGGAGKDTVKNFENLTGSSHNDTLTGSSGDNVIHGGAGNDTISGGNGNDTLDGGTGNDTLTGGSGNDVFVYAPGYGADRIADFSGGDKIDLTGFTDIYFLSDVLALSTQSGSNVVVNFGGGNTLTLANTSLASLTEDKFVLTPPPKSGSAPTAMELSAHAVVEGAPAGTAIGTLSTIDPDSGQTFTYKLVDSAGGLFAIDGDQLVVAGTVDYETAHTQEVTVRVTDSGYQTYDQTFAIDVTNVSPSTVTDANSAANKVAEGAATGTVVGITATSDDPGGGATYSLTDDAGGRFAINPATGVVTVANGALIDYETATSHTITVAATDGSATVTESFAIAITDVQGVTLNGKLRADTLTGTSENDTLNGNGGNDTLKGLGGDDVLNGGAGTDTAVYQGLSTDYSVVKNGNGTYTVTDLGSAFHDGTDTLTSIEKLAFSDKPGGVAIDTLASANTALGNPVVDDTPTGPFAKLLGGGSGDGASGGGSDVADTFAALLAHLHHGADLFG